jgi:hypothetical protein
LPRFEMARGDGFGVLVSSGGGHRGRDRCGAVERDGGSGSWWEWAPRLGNCLGGGHATGVNSGFIVDCLLSDTVKIQLYTRRKYKCCQLRGVF